MPFYDYYCEENNQTVEVRHAITVRLKTWGEVCRCAKKDPGRTPSKAKVIRLVGSVNPTVFRLKGLDKDAPTDKFTI